MTTNSWMVMNWYSDSTCKEFAGQTSFVLNSCVMVQNTTSSTYAYSILSATEDTQTGLGTLGQAFYSDSLCTVASATANVVSFDLQCTPQNNGYYQPSISTSGMPTSWESDGVLMALYPPTDSQCSDSTQQVYNTFAANDGGVCLPTFEDDYVESSNCQNYGYSHNNMCFNQNAMTWVLDDCYSGIDYTTQLNGQGFLPFAGYPKATCYTSTSSTDDNSGGSSSSNTDAIIGGAIGGAVVLIVLLAAAYWWLRGRKEPLSTQRSSEMTNSKA